MHTVIQFDEVARLPLPGDNVAIATRRLEAGTAIQYKGESLTLDYTVLEGHRFAIGPIAAGEALLSWELPFGAAMQPIRPGQYVINRDVLEALRIRSLDFALPPSANFVDDIPPFQLDEASFRPAPAAPAYAESRTFMGYRRSAARGVGTRNSVVLLGVSSRTGSYVKQLASRLQDDAERFPNVDGVVPAAHTEGGEEQPNNLQLLLRTLSGFLVNPNVGAVLIVDDGLGPVTNGILEQYARRHGYPLDDVLHRFVTLEGSFEAELDNGASIVREWLPAVGAMERTPESVAHLKIGLQCGGSDAFSGVSANPLLGKISEELVRYGGAANLAETDELIGAESYILQKVSDLATAHKFLSVVNRYRTMASWHGTNAEGNPSGGNKFRGLYNIYLKSIGAAMKKDPDTRLDHVIDYGEPMKRPGFYFMDSPGNDLESIAGQVAAGCNMIFFTTGNGSITNFPFVPTIKVVTTTQRFQLLSKDMDINAGQYLEGVSMEDLTKQAFDYALQVSSGARSVGEKAGHAQVQIWRNWRQSDASRLSELQQTPAPAGEPIAVRTDAPAGSAGDFAFTRGGERIGLILPTSLCSGQVARQIADRLNRDQTGRPEKVSRFVTLAHTEGCGTSGGSSEQLYARTMVSYVEHPMVAACLLLEHGCEKTHNDYMRHQLAERGVDAGSLGFASIQMDGGIEKVTRKVELWFAERLLGMKAPAVETAGLEGLRIGLLTDGPIDEADGERLALLTKRIVGGGGTVVVPQNSGLLASPAFADAIGLPSAQAAPSLSYGEHARLAGFHIMETPTEHWVETVTGLAATGMELLAALANRRPMQAHPFVPMLQMASRPEMQAHAADLDLALDASSSDWTEAVLERSKQILEGGYKPRMQDQGNVDFQLTRGFFGFSL